MKRIFTVLGLCLGLAVPAYAGSLALAATAAAAPAAIVWGHGEPHKYRHFTQGTTILTSPTGAERWHLAPRGYLGLQKYFSGAGPGFGWRPYWATHTGGRKATYHLYLGTNGRLILADRNLHNIWVSPKAPGVKYNYALQLDALGRLREWRATGNPLGRGRKLVWQIDRVVGKRTVCQGQPIDQSGTTNADVLTQGGAGISVTVHNGSYIATLPITVYRYWGGQEDNPQSYVIGFHGSHTFGGKGTWYGEDNLPEVVNMRIYTSSNDAIGSYSIKAWCWYRT